MEIFETLRALNACFGPSGQEEEVAGKLKELAGPLATDIRTDTMGNLIVHKAGGGPKVMFAAHMDSIGLMVTHIEDNGFLRVGKVGYVDPREVLGTPVRFANGVVGTLYEDEGLEETKREIGHLYVDVGAADAQAAKALAQVGDVAVFDTPTRRQGDGVFSPYLDNRISCAALLKAMELVQDSPNDLYFVFTVQEEVGTRGAEPAAFAIAPDYAVVADVTIANDLPGSKHSCSSKCGGGAAVKVMDNRVICHPEMVKRLEELAKAEGIPYQMDVISGGGTDGGPIHKSREGVYTGGVSVPCRYTHCPQEVALLSDAEACARLMAAFAMAELPPVGR